MVLPIVELIVFSLCVLQNVSHPLVCNSRTRQHEECVHKFKQGLVSPEWDPREMICMPCDELYPPMDPLTIDDPQMQEFLEYSNNPLKDIITDCLLEHPTIVQWNQGEPRILKHELIDQCLHPRIIQNLIPPYSHYVHFVTPCSKEQTQKVQEFEERRKFKEKCRELCSHELGIGPGCSHGAVGYT